MAAMALMFLGGNAAFAAPAVWGHSIPAGIALALAAAALWTLTANLIRRGTRLFDEADALDS